MAGANGPYLQPGTLVENVADVVGSSGRRFATGELRGSVLTCYRGRTDSEFFCRILTEAGELAICSTQDLWVVPPARPDVAPAEA